MLPIIYLTPNHGFVTTLNGTFYTLLTLLKVEALCACKG